MKLLKLGIRFWITASSILSFLIGWIMIAHAPTPVRSTATGSGSSSLAPLPTLEPLNSQPRSDDDDFLNQRPFFSTQPRNSSRPFFSTGGS